MKAPLLWLCIMLADCAHLGPAATCVSDPSLASEVVADLRSDDYVKLLEALAAKVGLCVVDRTVESLLPAKAASDPAIVKHAQVWLATHPA